MIIKRLCQNAVKQSYLFGHRIPLQSMGGKATDSISNISTVLNNGNGPCQRFNSSQTTPSMNDGPSLEVAKSMQTDYRSMDNYGLVLLANIDSPPVTGAREEVLKRHIMR